MTGFIFFIFMTPIGFLCGYLTGKLNVGVVPSMLVYAVLQLGGLFFLYGTGMLGDSAGFLLILFACLFILLQAVLPVFGTAFLTTSTVKFRSVRVT